jgi:hypothetical protein
MRQKGHGSYGMILCQDLLYAIIDKENRVLVLEGFAIHLQKKSVI